MKSARLIFLTLLLSGNVLAQDIKIIGSINQSIQPVRHYQLSAQSSSKQVKLLKIQLSDRGRQTISNRAQKALQHSNRLRPHSNYPQQQQLGMNNVPVLDQGSHGSCATFANTAAIDAALNKGDYISQLCHLQLGNYLEKNAYSSSGWDGSLGRTILNQIEVFGIVSKEQQRANGCGGLTEYPLEGDDPQTEMSVADYYQLSEALFNNSDSEGEGTGASMLIWSPVLDVYEAVLERTDTAETIQKIKTALNAGDRATFGVLLADADLGTAGAVGKHQASNDTWVLTTEIARDLYLRPFFGGHEMIITGYDDNAIAIDDKGRQYQGLFTLRNSWGEDVGDHGEFYMSYDYFKVLVIEAQRIRSITD